MMKTVLKYLSVLVLAALGAGVVLYVDEHCPEKQLAKQAQLEKSIALYINNHPHVILEAISKSDNFGTVVRSFSATGDGEMNEKLKYFLENNSYLLESFISNNASTVIKMLADTDDFKQAVATAALTVESIKEASPAKEETAAQDNPNQKFIDHWEEMSNGNIAPYVGPQDAKVSVVEFFDFACGHCKALAPIMSRLRKDNPDVKFVFHPLYFMSEHSPYAAKVSLVAFEKGKFAEVFDGMMTLPELNEEAVNQILVDEGLNADEIKKMSEEKKIRRGLQEIDSLSQVLGINGVPMLLINGEPFYGRSYEDLQNKLNSLK